MTPLDQQFANFELGKDYPKPIVDIKQTRKKASDILYKMRQDPEVLLENKRILKKHTITDRKKLLKSD
jgi:deoxyribodipyrimidine photo-lyase